jgi:hypothetical protein
MFKYETCSDAAAAGDLEEIKKRHQSGYKWNSGITFQAAKNGHLDCLKYLHEHGCPWDEWIPVFAAKNGHLDCLKYAHENNCPWNSKTATYASEEGQIECLMYAHSHGCPLDEHATAFAAKNGHLNCLKYLHKNNCPWNEWCTLYAAAYGNLDCLKYAHENGCPWDERTIVYASVKRHEECLRYAKAHGCPCDTVMYQFLYSSINYTNTLSEMDKLAIKMYTGNYFFRAINASQQNLLDTEKLPEDWEESAKMYCEAVNYNFNPYEYTFTQLVNFISYLIHHINKIILNAPEIIQPIKVYRGVKTPYFLSTDSEVFIHAGFLSTSLSIDVAKRFANGQYMLESSLQPGTKCIYYEVEKEVILPINTKVKILSEVPNTEYIGYYIVEYSS